MFGSDMLGYLQSRHEEVTGLNSDELNLTSDIETIQSSIKDFDVVINATAFTNVDLAEKEKGKAFAVNKEVPEKLAKITAAYGQKLIHISTDYVFDGTKKSPYLTSDKPNPINTYGETKLAGEKALSEANPQGIIIRTSWLYGPNGQSFPKAIIDKLTQDAELWVVDDQFGTPTSTWFLSEFCYKVVKENLEGGIHHGVPSGITSWYGFAKAISSGFSNPVYPKQTDLDDRRAKRPPRSQLSPSPLSSKSWEQCWDEIRGEFSK